MIRAFLATLRRDLAVAARQKSDWLLPPLFFLIVVTLFGLGSKPNDPQLAAFAPAVLWVGALLAALLPLDRLFRGEQEDGSLEQIFLVPGAPLAAVYAKVLGHWLLSGLPLSLLAVPLGLQLGLPADVLPVTLASLLLGTPLLSLLGGFAAALTVGLPRAGVLLPILVLPLFAPILIFGAGATRSSIGGLDPAGPLYFLAALLVLGACLLPLAAAAALRNALE